MEKNILKELVKPFQDDSLHPYYRPFVSRGNQNKFNAFLVGINPATPIYSDDIELDEYVDLLMDYDRFYREYKSIRKSTGKKRISRTRTGIMNFVKEFEVLTGEPMLETNVIPYPTKNIKELNKVHPDAIKHGLNLFYTVLKHHSPKIIIVHGKKSAEYLIKFLIENDIIETPNSINQNIKEIEHSEGPFLTFTYENGDQGAVFVCRHFMYYGKEGKSFSFFKDKVVNHLEKN